MLFVKENTAKATLNVTNYKDKYNFWKLKHFLFVFKNRTLLRKKCSVKSKSELRPKLKLALYTLLFG